MIDLAAETDRLLEFAPARATPTAASRGCATTARRTWRARASCGSHADDARVRARRAARAPGRRELVDRRSRRCAPTSATTCTAAGSRGRRAGRQARVRARLRRAGGGERGRSRAARRGAGGARHALLGRARGRARRRVEPRLDRLEPYRGANANMHGVEAMLATGDPLWLERAGRITQRFVGDNHPRLNEHFDADWRPLPQYNRDRSRAPVPALRRDDRALVRVGAARLHARRRPLRGGRAAAVRGRDVEGWDGGGFVYTVDWDGRPVIRDRLHWVLCEAIAAAAVLGEDALQARVVGARRARVHRSRGRLRGGPSSTRRNRPSSLVWDGKPDVYHALQATLIPRVPLAPSLAAACGARPATRRPSRPPGLPPRGRSLSAAASSPRP